MTLLKLTFILTISLILTSCGGKFGGDARKNPPDPKERVKRNLEEGKALRLSNMMKKQGSGNFEFASSNELWRASLDTIDFIPLASVNYSGGLIVTDWYNNNQIADESIKISIRFLTNEIRSDALDIKVFTKKCVNGSSCQTFETSGALVPELTRQILKTAALYEKERKDKTKEKNKNYKVNYPDMN